MPASQCGGDWWMYRKLPDGRMLLVLGDATGHGIHSAMIAATARFWRSVFTPVTFSVSPDSWTQRPV